LNTGYIGNVIDALCKFRSPGIVDAFFFEQCFENRMLFQLIDDRHRQPSTYCRANPTG